MFKKIINKFTGKKKEKEEVVNTEEELNEANENDSKSDDDFKEETIANEDKKLQNIQKENMEVEAETENSYQEDIKKEKETQKEELKDSQEPTEKVEESVEKSKENNKELEKEEFDENKVEEKIEETKEVSEEKTDEMEELEEIEKPEENSKFNLFKRLKEGLSKTKNGITGKVDDLLKSYKKIDEDLFEELEEILITSDMGVQTTMEIIDDLRDRVKKEKVSDPADVKQLLMDKLTEILEDLPDSEINIDPSPAIILVVGVNGVGKTTSIGKMAYRFKGEGKKVLLAAGDTFRAAAIDQLKIWGDRVGVDVIRHQEESDPAAVIYDAVQAAKARGTDVLICDTAGRLHNKKNLMNELGKIFKVVDREYEGATKEVLLVLDATTGQNAVQQAKTFKEVANITGLVLTKLDGTAKGGVVVGISRELNVPVKLIGVGEQMEDLQKFDPNTFVKAIFGEEE